MLSLFVLTQKNVIFSVVTNLRFMSRPISVLWLIPSKKNSPLDMIFAKRGLPFLEENGIKIHIYNFYESKSVYGIVKEIFFIRKFARLNNIDFIHAHYGSTTSLVALLAGLP